ncbi:MAG: ATP-binding protein [Endomicrobium sp.]|jgi:predicted AAA+ superfamily ATPase|nr:ATP-binding protein [Endomicrobium sp.]
MLKRKIINQLLAWKNKRDKMALLIKGARQVGKTFIIEKFAKENYENYVYFNFEIDPSYKDIFQGDLNVNNLIEQMSLRIPNVKLVPGKTVIFLDEIQNCPQARTALKSFSLDKRFDVIASGSLLGINYKEVRSFPVGYVEYLEMHSLDFEEFLWAIGISEKSIQDLKNYFDKKEQLPISSHEVMMKYFKQYIVVGGMPRVVDEFVKTRNFANVLSLQKGIVTGYLDDIAKYADGAEKTKARACFLSIPKQLAKDYKKFQYSVVEHGATAKRFTDSLMWLYDAGIINFCYNLLKPEIPFEGNSSNDIFKVYMRDTGLLMSMLGENVQADIIDGNLGIYKGAIYENIIADIFTKLGKNLYYFEKKSHLEIDFFIRVNKIAVAIDVKSADNTKSKSVVSILNNYNVQRAIKLSSKNISSSDKIDYIPLYMAMFL